ncbi:MAG TPA: response regulator [Bryobacteraceae bacterium]|nr:response regulator [Bryobacteraceae bacterium]
MLQATKKIVAVLDDLFFTVKIMDAAKRAGLEIVFVKDEEKVLALARELPALIIFDLNAHCVNAVDLIQQLKRQPETKELSLIGFVSHVQIDLKQRAQAAGADAVLPRSTFSTNLPAILKRHVEALAPEA